MPTECPFEVSTPATEFAKLSSTISMLPVPLVEQEKTASWIEEQQIEARFPNDNWSLERSLAVLADDANEAQRRGVERVLGIVYVQTILMSALYILNNNLQEFVHDAA